MVLKGYLKNFDADTKVYLFKKEIYLLYPANWDIINTFLGLLVLYAIGQ